MDFKEKREITSDDDDHRLSPTTHVANTLCVISKEN